MSTPWLLRARPLFGKVSDQEIANRFSVARSIVSRHRRRLGIPPVRNVKPRGRSWLARVRPMFGKLSDREIGRRTGLHRKTIGEARRSLGVRSAPRRATTEADRSWVPSVRHLLGKVTDAELGKRVGRSGATVGMARRELGIKRGHRRPAVHGSDKAPLTNALLRSRRSATEIAHMTGIAVSTIYGRRRSMGVPTPARRS